MVYKEYVRLCTLMMYEYVNYVHTAKKTSRELPLAGTENETMKKENSLLETVYVVAYTNAEVGGHAVAG